jgi:hypothetical protein
MDGGLGRRVEDIPSSRVLVFWEELGPEQGHFLWWDVL